MNFTLVFCLVAKKLVRLTKLKAIGVRQAYNIFASSSSIYMQIFFLHLFFLRHKKYIIDFCIDKLFTSMLKTLESLVSLNKTSDWASILKVLCKLICTRNLCYYTKFNFSFNLIMTDCISIWWKFHQRKE